MKGYRSRSIPKFQNSKTSRLTILRSQTMRYTHVPKFTRVEIPKFIKRFLSYASINSQEWERILRERERDHILMFDIVHFILTRFESTSVSRKTQAPDLFY